MLIGISGGVAAGSTTVADYLVKEYGFKKVFVVLDQTLPSTARTREWRAEFGLKQWHVDKAAKDRRSEEEVFPTVNALLDHVTHHWQGRWTVTTDMWSEKDVRILHHRPAFLHISVDAPASLRYQRLKQVCIDRDVKPPTLTNFLTCDELERYAPEFGLACVAQHAQINLVNSSSSLDTLHKALRVLDLPNEERLRPSWDSYFMQLADLAAQRSNCMKRRVGCVLAREKRVVSTGYNGTPRGMKNCNQGGCPRCNSSGNKAGAALDTCLCLHAEENALLEAGRERIRDGSILYCNTCPCLTCSVKIAQVGISEVVYSTGYHVDSAAAAIFEEAGVKLRQFSPPREGLIYLGTTADVEVLLP